MLNEGIAHLWLHNMSLDPQIVQIGRAPSVDDLSFVSTQEVRIEIIGLTDNKCADLFFVANLQFCQLRSWIGADIYIHQFGVHLAQVDAICGSGSLFGRQGGVGTWAVGGGRINVRCFA